MDWSNWSSVLFLVFLVLCCGGMMMGMGRGRRHEQDRHEKQEKRPEEVGKNGR